MKQRLACIEVVTNWMEQKQRVLVSKDYYGKDPNRGKLHKKRHSRRNKRNRYSLENVCTLNSEWQRWWYMEGEGGSYVD